MAENQSYISYQKNRQVLATLIQQQLAVLETLDLKGLKDRLQRLEKRVLADNFKVLVMGEFKRGKSTFINSMLGQKILPAYTKPCTAIINEVKWGDRQRALLYPRKSPDELSGEPMEISVDQLTQYVVIKTSSFGSVQQGSRLENPYEKVELFWPLDLCRNGIEIIDSPGLNEDAERQKITIDYLPTVDAVIFVLSCEALVSTTEKVAIESIRELGHESLFFICNRFNLVPEEEQDDLKQHARTILNPLTKEGNRYIFFVNALGALEGRLKGDQEQVKLSNIPKVESELKIFLASERGRIKLVPPTTELRASIREARRLLPDRRRMLDIDLETLQARYAEAQKTLEQYEEEHKQIVAKVALFRKETAPDVNNAANRFYADTADNMRSWLNKYEVQEPVKIPELFSTQAKERVVQEVTKFLAAEVGRESKAWQKATLEPMLSRRFETLMEDLNTRTKTFAEGLEQIRLELAADASESLSLLEARADQVTALERILAAAGGFAMGGNLGGAILGGVFGFKEMLKSMVPQLIIYLATAMLLSWNPIALGAVLLGSSLLQGLLKTTGITKKIRDAVGKEYIETFRAARPNLANAVTKAVDMKFSDLQDALDQGLGLEIQNIRDQVNSVIAEKQQGQARVNEAIRRLEAIPGELDKLESEIDALVERVI
jgi:GTPase SAR1 family protein